MSQEYCWECEHSYANDEVFDIHVFNKGYTIKWCLNCAMKQLLWTDYRLIPNPTKYKKFRIKSIEDKAKEFQIVLDELLQCYELQLGELNNEDWERIMHIAQYGYGGEE